MQTFLPYKSFKDSAIVLDNKRLNKQIVEANQILFNILLPENERNKWKHHPAVLMWIGYEHSLMTYIIECIQEWYNRGGKGHYEILEAHLAKKDSYPEINPYWLGDKLLHSSHKSNLLFKDSYYEKFQWDEYAKPYLPYVWPTFYSDFENKILTKEGIKSLTKSLKKKGLWIDQNFRWPGSNAELGIY